MRTKKRLASLMLATVIVMSFGFSVSANNNSDTYYSYYQLPAYTSYVVLTPGRSKTDKSSTYVYFYSTNNAALNTYGVQYSVHGGSSSSTYVVNCTSYVSSCLIYPGFKRLIHQNVYELGYTYAFLGLSAPNVQVQGTSPDGLWSPDSTGTYIYAN